MKIMPGRINMTQAQLEALVQAQVAAALAAAQAGSIPCSIAHTRIFRSYTPKLAPVIKLCPIRTQ